MSEPRAPEPQHRSGWTPSVPPGGSQAGDGQPPAPAPDGWGPATWSPIPQQSPPLDGLDGATPQAGPPLGWAGPMQYPPLPGLPMLVSAMPDGERTYPQMLRGPRRRWWRPLLALVIGGGLAVAAQFLALIPFVAFGAVATRGQDLQGWIGAEFDKLLNRQIDAAGFFLNNLTLIALIPAAGLSIWAAHHIRPRFVSSVVGGFRWRWLLRCLLVVVPLWAIYTVAGVLLDPQTPDRPAEWVLLLVLVVVMTPLQAAGEEYFFRGWILQNVGSWFKRPMLSLASGTLVSAVAFSAAHGSPDPWIIGSLALFAISCCVLTWRTGGLEAAIAIHAVNNISAFFAVINFGGWDRAFIGADTKGTPAQFAVDAAVQVIAFALIWWQAKRAKVRSRYQPTDAPAVARPPGPQMLAVAPPGRPG